MQTSYNILSQMCQGLLVSRPGLVPSQWGHLLWNEGKAFSLLSSLRSSPI